MGWSQRSQREKYFRGHEVSPPRFPLPFPSHFPPHVASKSKFIHSPPVHFPNAITANSNPFHPLPLDVTQFLPPIPSLLRKGTSIRRTNETDMNAQSSRSHAIFSLTLTQKKYVGSNPLPPPRSSSPLPPGGPGRSPSRLARPGSMIVGPSNRVSSPTPGRPGTPSFGSAINRSSIQGSSLRPPSSLGFAHADREPTESITPGGDGDWVTVVSKFHFVDLAGSERVRFICLSHSCPVSFLFAS